MHNTSLILVNKTTGSLNLDEVYSRKSVKLYIKNSILKKTLKAHFHGKWSQTKSIPQAKSIVIYGSCCFEQILVLIKNDITVQFYKNVLHAGKIFLHGICKTQFF